MELIDEWKDIAICHLEPNVDSLLLDSVCFNPNCYTLNKLDIFTPEAVEMMLKIHPIFVIRKKRSSTVFYIISGCRTFQAASFCFLPSRKIPVAVIDSKTPKKQLELLRYLDLSVNPLFFRVDNSLADNYQLICASEARQQVLMPPYNTSMHAFAVAVGVVPSTLCRKPPVDEIKLIYLLLCLPEFVDLPYKQLADSVGIPLTAVVLTMEKLKQNEFIVVGDDNRKRLVKRKELLNRWIDDYHKYLKPRLLIGTFRADHEWWQAANHDPSVAQWGGEIAARKTTKYYELDDNTDSLQYHALKMYESVNPETVILYSSKEHLSTLIRENSLKEDPHGNIEIVERFWRSKELLLDGETVILILVYADLMGTKNKSRIQMADEFYRQFLKRQFEG